jgi:hypothetical protein
MLVLMVLYNRSYSFQIKQCYQPHHNQFLAYILYFEKVKLVLWQHLAVCICVCMDRLYGLVVKVPGYRSRGPGSILGTTRFSEK